MLTVLRSAILAAIALLFTAQAKAATDYGPADTATFISSCATNFEACRNEVVTISNYNQMSQITGSAYPGCTFPHVDNIHTDSISATNAIINWLNTHSATRAPKTDDAVAQAMKAIWPNLCKH